MFIYLPVKHKTVKVRAKEGFDMSISYNYLYLYNKKTIF